MSATGVGRDTSNRLFRLDALAEMASVSIRTLQRCITAGDLAVVKLGRSTRVTADSWQRFVSKGGRRQITGMPPSTRKQLRRRTAP